jgi:hypothetical protein
VSSAPEKRRERTGGKMVDGKRQGNKRERRQSAPALVPWSLPLTPWPSRPRRLALVRLSALNTCSSPGLLVLSTCTGHSSVTVSGTLLAPLRRGTSPRRALVLRELAVHREAPALDRPSDWVRLSALSTSFLRRSYDCAGSGRSLSLTSRASSYGVISVYPGPCLLNSLS